MGNYSDIIEFIKELERLKDITRTAWTRNGKQESVAEHSWRLAMFALVLQDYFIGFDMNRVIHMCLLHDLGEAYEGDVSAKIQTDQVSKLKSEKEAIQKLLLSLPENLQSKLMELWKEYNEGETKEAKLAKALDKMETIIQHNQGSNPEDFDYIFNIKYGSEYADFNDVVREIRNMIDDETISKAKATMMWTRE
ncbi:MAG: HD domain-containing protein [Bacillota bacterium]